MSTRSLFDFSGGLVLESHKQHTRGLAVRSVPMPQRLIMPLRQHIGTLSKPLVELGQKVARGECIARSGSYVGASLHAPTSGTISTIDDFPVIHASGQMAPCIELTPDGEHRAIATHGLSKTQMVDRREIFAAIAQAGIVGLGGAGFPTDVKIREGAAQPVDVLIINGVECEPYITCDDLLIQTNAEQILIGAQLISAALEAKTSIVAVEDDMVDAYEALRRIHVENVEVLSVPAIYPAGGEKQLIKVLTGREVPSGALPIDIRVVVLNVATTYAIYQALTAGTPLLERYVTVAGTVEKPGNFKVMVGTPIKDLLDAAGFVPDDRLQILSGGPMMGVAVNDPCVPIAKTTNCILVMEAPHNTVVSPCIRCGECVPVCPVGLQPQQLYDSSRMSDFDSAQDLHLFDCIECGCCAYVCPSNIPLVHYYRYAKSSIESLDRDRLDADGARERFVARQNRHQIANSLEVSVGATLAAVDSLDDDIIKNEIAAALSRAKQRRGDH